MNDSEAHRLALLPTGHDFVQSAVWAGQGCVVTGGESGALQLHDLRHALPHAQAAGHADEGGAGAQPPPPPPACGQGGLVGHSGAVLCLALSARGVLVSGSVDHSLRTWDLATGKALATLAGHSRSVHCVAAHELDAGSAHGQGSEVLFSGSRDHSIRVRARAPR